MSKKKIVYPVTYEKVKTINAEYIILNGGRNGGKSYAVKKLIILDHLLQGKKMMYIRRRKEEIKDKDFDYFEDMPINELTNGKYDSIGSYQKNIYFQKLNEKTGKFENVLQVGKQFALQSERAYRSHVYKDYTVGVYEEFVSTDIYLNNEPDILLNLSSTVLRANKGVLYMVGNLTNRNNPYFRDWQLIHYGTQKLDTIDYYDIDNVKIALYRCPDSIGLNKMTFGHSKKAMDGVEYESTPQPKLFDDIENFRQIYTMVFEYNQLRYLMMFLQHYNGNYVWYVTPKTTEIQKNTRLITNQFINGNPYATNGFVPLNGNEKQLFWHIDNNNICFSDNLTGTEFWKFYKEMR